MSDELIVPEPPLSQDEGLGSKNRRERTGLYVAIGSLLTLEAFVLMLVEAVGLAVSIIDTSPVTLEFSFRNPYFWYAGILAALPIVFFLVLGAYLMKSKLTKRLLMLEILIWVAAHIAFIAVPTLTAID
jgi:hypothetical protein